MIYDRSSGTLVSSHEYEDAELTKANSDRLKAEIEYATSPEVEIAILRSASLDELQRTHARYFKSLSQLQRLSAT